MVSAPLEDLVPFLSEEELKKNMYIPLLREQDMKKVIITGATSMVGIAIIEVCLEKNRQNICNNKRGMREKRADSERRQNNNNRMRYGQILQIARTY